MDDLRIITVVNEELILSVSAMAEDIWHEHYDKLIGCEQVDYMLEKFLSPDALCEQINNGYEYFLISHEYTFAGFAGVLENKDEKSLFLSKLYIHEESRGKHISTEMLKKFVELCKLRNLEKSGLHAISKTLILLKSINISDLKSCAKNVRISVTDM